MAMRFQNKEGKRNQTRTEKKYKKVKMTTAILTLLCLLVCGCASNTTSTAKTEREPVSSLWEEPLEQDLNTVMPDGEPIRIGAIYALSGNNAAIGTNILRGIDFAVEQINSEGGIHGRPLEVVRGDSQGSTTTAREVARKLIEEDHVAAILGCHQSTLTEVVFDVCEEYQIPMITAISTVDQITAKEREYVFRLCPMNSLYVEDMFQYLEDQETQTGAEIQKIAVFADTSMIGDEAVKNARFYAEKYDLTIAAEIRYDVGTANLDREVEELIKAAPDAVIAESYASDAILFLKAMDDHHYTPPVLIAKANGYTDPSFLSAASEISEGLISVVEWNPDMAKGQEINEAFEKIFDMPMNGHSAEVYTAVWTLKTAFEMAESTSGEDVKNALQSLDLRGEFPNGPEIMLPYDGICFENIKRDGVTYHNENRYASVAIAQIQKGEYRTVWPFDYADAEILAIP